MTPPFVAFWLMVGVALGGATLALTVFLGINVPRALRVVHGVGALLALAILGTANSIGPTHPLAWWAFGVWSAGLVGGVLFFRVLFPGRPPRMLVVGHGALGLIGLALLYPVAFAA